MTEPLTTNIVWTALVGTQAGLACGTGGARRYQPGYSPLAAFADPDEPDVDALAGCTAAGEALFVPGWTGPCPGAWEVTFEGMMKRMAFYRQAPPPSEDERLVDLDPSWHGAMQGLARLTRPGPFGPKTPQMGDYVGRIDKGTLVAMAGERIAFDDHVEISGVCTHPDRQGEGLARRLMNLLIARQRARSKTPFLHVIDTNVRAHGLYLDMGFVDVCDVPLRVVKRR